MKKQNKQSQTLINNSLMSNIKQLKRSQLKGTILKKKSQNKQFSLECNNNISSSLLRVKQTGAVNNKLNNNVTKKQSISQHYQQQKYSPVNTKGNSHNKVSNNCNNNKQSHHNKQSYNNNANQVLVLNRNKKQTVDYIIIDDNIYSANSNTQRNNYQQFVSKVKKQKQIQRKSFLAKSQITSSQSKLNKFKFNNNQSSSNQNKNKRNILWKKLSSKDFISSMTIQQKKQIFFKLQKQIKQSNNYNQNNKNSNSNNNNYLNKINSNNYGYNQNINNNEDNIRNKIQINNNKNNNRQPVKKKNQYRLNEQLSGQQYYNQTKNSASQPCSTQSFQQHDFSISHRQRINSQKYRKQKFNLIQQKLQSLKIQLMFKWQAQIDKLQQMCTLNKINSSQKQNKIIIIQKLKDHKLKILDCTKVLFQKILKQQQYQNQHNQQKSNKIQAILQSLHSFPSLQSIGDTYLQKQPNISHLNKSTNNNKINNHQEINQINYNLRSQQSLSPNKQNKYSKQLQSSPLQIVQDNIYNNNEIFMNELRQNSWVDLVNNNNEEINNNKESNNNNKYKLSELNNNNNQNINNRLNQQLDNNNQNKKQNINQQQQQQIIKSPLNINNKQIQKSRFAQFYQDPQSIHQLHNIYNHNPNTNIFNSNHHHNISNKNKFNYNSNNNKYNQFNTDHDQSQIINKQPIIIKQTYHQINNDKISLKLDLRLDEVIFGQDQYPQCQHNSLKHYNHQQQQKQKQFKQQQNEFIIKQSKQQEQQNYLSTIKQKQQQKQSSFNQSQNHSNNYHQLNQNYNHLNTNNSNHNQSQSNTQIQLQQTEIYFKQPTPNLNPISPTYNDNSKISLSKLNLQLSSTIPSQNIQDDLSCTEKPTQKMNINIPMILSRQKMETLAFQQNRTFRQNLDKKIAFQMGCLELQSPDPIAPLPFHFTTLVDINTYIIGFYEFMMKKYMNSLVDNLNIPYGKSAVDKLFSLQSQGFVIQQSYNEMNNILGENHFNQYQRQIMFTLRKCTQFQNSHNRAVFDAFTKCINVYRPYFQLQGEVFPWIVSQKGITFYQITDDNIQQVFEKSKIRVLQYCTSLCGLHPPFQVMNEQQVALMNHKNQQNLTKMIKSQILQHFEQWKIRYVNFDCLVRTLISDKIYQSIIDQCVQDIILFQQQNIISS